MGKGWGKGQRRSKVNRRAIVVIDGERGNGEGGNVTLFTKGGLTQKTMKDAGAEEEVIRLEVNDGDVDRKGDVTKFVDTDNVIKMDKFSLVKGNLEPVQERNSVGVKDGAGDLKKFVGLRQDRSIRKMKPRRAAGVGVQT